MVRETDSSPSEFMHAEHSHWAIDVSIDRLRFSQDKHGLCGKYSRLLYQFYDRALSTSTDFTRLLVYLPGFVAWKSPVPIEWLEDIYDVSNEVLLLCLERNVPFIRRWQQSPFEVEYSDKHQPFDVLYMNAHLSNFLFHWEAGLHYQDLGTQYTNAFLHLITTVFDQHWIEKPTR